MGDVLPAKAEATAGELDGGVLVGDEKEAVAATEVGKALAVDEPTMSCSSSRVRWARTGSSTGSVLPPPLLFRRDLTAKSGSRLGACVPALDFVAGAGLEYSLGRRGFCAPAT